MKILICAILGHKKPFNIIRCVESLAIYEVRCSRCGLEYVLNRRVEALLPLNSELILEHDSILGEG